MKIFVVKLFCFILLLLVLDVVCGKVFSTLHQMASDNSPRGLLTEYAMEKVNAELIIIGASRANHHYVSSVIKDSLGMSVYNAGKDGHDFLYQCCLIDGILHRYVPKIIIWDVQPGDLSRPVQYDFDRLTDLNIYYDKNEYCRDLINQRGPYEKYKMFFYSYRYNSKLLSYIYKSIFSYNYPIDGYQPSTDKHNYPILKEEKVDTGFDRKQLSRITAIINICKEKQVKLIVSLSPKFVNSDYLQADVYKKLREVLKEEDIPLIDFYSDSFFRNDSTLFNDNAHLNNRGAQSFTEKWLEKYALQRH